MTTSRNLEPAVSRVKTALLGVAGTGVASFLPGLLVSVTWTFVRGDYHKLGPGGTVAVLVFIWAVFTAVTLATYVVELLPLFLVARVTKASHAFWLAVLVSLLTAPAIASGHPAVVAGLHLILFSILCVLYRQLVRRGNTPAG